ncbi:hypothetical protein, partial [Prevotella intermedia]|uniref:hypothetical protein n=1 Tax=Prevotella intermedia TaxID=28131 RepID=UPI0005EB4869
YIRRFLQVFYSRVEKHTLQVPNKRLIPIFFSFGLQTKSSPKHGGIGTASAKMKGFYSVGTLNFLFFWF